MCHTGLDKHGLATLLMCILLVPYCWYTERFVSNATSEWWAWLWFFVYPCCSALWASKLSRREGADRQSQGAISCARVWLPVVGCTFLLACLAITWYGAYAVTCRPWFGLGAADLFCCPCTGMQCNGRGACVPALQNRDGSPGVCVPLPGS